MKSLLLSTAAVAALGVGVAFANPNDPPADANARLDRLERTVEGLGGLMSRIEGLLEQRATPTQAPAAGTKGQGGESAPAGSSAPTAPAPSKASSAPPATPSAPAAASGAPPSGAASGEAPAATPSAQRVQLRPGWLVRVHPIEGEGFAAADLGEFVLTTNPTRMNAHQREVPSNAIVGYQAEGLFIAREAGRYVFQASMTHPGAGANAAYGAHPFNIECVLRLAQGDTQVLLVRLSGGGYDSNLSAESVGSLEVSQPGAIPMTFSVGCRVPQGQVASPQLRHIASRHAQAEFRLSLRGPNERTLRLAAARDFVHRD